MRLHIFIFTSKEYVDGSHICQLGLLVAFVSSWLQSVELFV